MQVFAFFMQSQMVSTKNIYTIKMVDILILFGS